MELKLTLIPLLLAMVISLIVTPMTIYVYRFFGWVVDPKASKHPAHTHAVPVPKGGGIPVFVATIIPALLFLPLDRHLVAILIAGLLVVTVGTLDDVLDINPYIRLVTNLVAALIVIGSGIGIAFVTNPLTGGIIDLSGLRISFDLFGGQHSIWILADLFALLWIPFVMNATNWSKGLDGQLPGVVTIAALAIGILSFKFSADVTQWPVAVLAFALAGAYAGYLPFNFYPQRSMPGYGGGSFAGFMLATLAILSTTKVGTALVVLGVPLIDAIYVGARRILSGRSPVWGDPGHLHHRLLQLGWGKRRIAIFYWSVTAILAVVAIKLNSTLKFYTIMLTALVIGAFLLWIYFGHSSEQPDRDSG